MDKTKNTQRPFLQHVLVDEFYILLWYVTHSHCFDNDFWSSLGLGRYVDPMALVPSCYHCSKCSLCMPSLLASQKKLLVVTAVEGPKEIQTMFGMPMQHPTHTQTPVYMWSHNQINLTVCLTTWNSCFSFLFWWVWWGIQLPRWWCAECESTRTICSRDSYIYSEAYSMTLDCEAIYHVCSTQDSLLFSNMGWQTAVRKSRHKVPLPRYDGWHIYSSPCW